MAPLGTKFKTYNKLIGADSMQDGFLMAHPTTLPRLNQFPLFSAPTELIQVRQRPYLPSRFKAIIGLIPIVHIA